MAKQCFDNGRIFDGDVWQDGKSLLIEDGKVLGVIETAAAPSDAVRIEASGQIIVPGFIDLQVNGGGGVMFNDAQTVAGIATICAAHAKFGTTALLPTLITDTPAITAAAIQAGLDARAAKVAGFLGLHLEGPHLSVARKGAHDPALIRPMTEEDLVRLEAIGAAFDALLITVAPENVSQTQVQRLTAAGFTVSLGHTNASYETASSYQAMGARCATHLFNAMSQLENRGPGLVGAALDLGGLYAGIIADGIHVHPGAMGVALRAKKGPGKLFVVTDAMSTIGTNLESFMLNGREILRKDGKLTLTDGTLAGADIDMLSSVLFLHRVIGLSLEAAVKMATTHPAEAVGVQNVKGSLKPGYDADFVVLNTDLGLASTWIGGACVHSN